MPVYTWGEELLQTSLQFQQDQPQLRLWVPKNVQSRTDQCKGGAVQQYSPKILTNTHWKVLDDGGVLDIRAIITFKGKVGGIQNIVYCQPQASDSTMSALKKVKQCLSIQGVLV